MRNDIISIIVISIIFLSCAIFSVYQHELAHQQISIYHGCFNGTVEMNFFFDPSNFKCYEYSGTTPEIRQQEVFLHSINEIVGYNVMVIMLGFFILCITLIFVFGGKE